MSKHKSNYIILSGTNLKHGCNFVSCKMRIGFLGTFVQNSSAIKKL